jgi:hypothetical protein
VNVDTAEFAAITDQAAEAAAARAEKDAVLHHIRTFYALAYEDGADDALGRPRRNSAPRPPLRLVR